LSKFENSGEKNKKARIVWTRFALFHLFLAGTFIILLNGARKAPKKRALNFLALKFNALFLFE